MSMTANPLPPAPRCATSQEVDELPLPYIEIDARGLVTRANPAALALHHPDHGSLVGKLGWNLIAVDEKDLSSASFLSLMESGEDPPIVARSIFDRSGTFRTYQLHRSMIRNAAGKPVGMRIIGVDVTETAMALEEERRERRWLESAIASLAEAVVLTDILGVVRSINPAAEALFGYSSGELTGKVIEEALPLLSYQAIERNTRGIATIKNRAQSEVKFEMSTSPHVDKVSGAVIGVVSILRRIDDVK
jgi:PAS domain S-box-containing protein